MFKKDILAAKSRKPDLAFDQQSQKSRHQAELLASFTLTFCE